MGGVANYPIHPPGSTRALSLSTALKGWVMDNIIILIIIITIIIIIIVIIFIDSSFYNQIGHPV